MTVKVYVILTEFEDPDVKVPYANKDEDDDSEVEENLSDSDPEMEDVDELMDSAQV